MIGPWIEGTVPSRQLAFAAAIVTVGAVVIEGLGRTDAIGIAYAVGVFVCEACFTLLALPLMRRHGPLGITIYTTAIATGLFFAAAAVFEGVTVTEVFAPLAAAFTGMAIGLHTPSASVWAGGVLVAVGLAMGSRPPGWLAQRFSVWASLFATARH